jgi:antitoxin component of MazEF toxin-antitoxin module
MPRAIVRIARRGNSDVVTIPRMLMVFQRWNVGTALHIIADGERIVLERVADPTAEVNARKVDYDTPAPANGEPR